MAYQMRVDFGRMPTHVANQVYGNLKHRGNLLDALKYFDGYAHINELFHYLNTDEDGKWLKVTSDRGTTKGQTTVPVPMATIRQHLTSMLDIGDIVKPYDRKPIYALPGVDLPDEGTEDEPDESDEDESEEDETEE